MSEDLDRVRGVSELPLFPLEVVLFPGTPMPLHIFEPRYRQMMADIRVRENLFGLSYFDADASGLDMPPVGHVGCAAEIRETQELEDGRSNILTIGVARYRLEAYAETGDPYLVGKLSFFEDEAEDEDLLERRAAQVSELFLRIARAVRALNDERAALPELPETTPAHLSFLVSAAMEVDLQVKQELLELRYTSERLKRLRDLLTRAVGGYEERARLHTLAQGNGHSGRKLNLE